MLQDPSEQPEETAPSGARTAGRFLLPLILIALGVAMLAVLSRVEAAYLLRQKWSEGVLYIDARTSDPAAMPVYVRRLPPAHSNVTAEFVSELLTLPDGEKIVSQLGLDHGEYVVMAPVTMMDIAALLEKGRPPEPGTYEAVAGDLAERDSFELDGKVFQVVGRMRRGIAGLAYTFLIPEHPSHRPLFSPEAGATRGYYDPVGLPNLKKRHLDASAQSPAEDGPAAAAESRPKTTIPIARTLSQVVAGTVIGLMLIALGGALVQYRILSRLGQRPDSRGYIFTLVGDRRRIFAFVNVALYGIFFATMLLALATPLASLRLATYVGREFAEGQLSYIGQAYQSGDIYLAAAATFAHNYLQATVLYTILPSLIIPFSGFLKNLVTFGMVGYVMAPQWVGSVGTLVYHSITMILEFEAYIVASFTVVMFPLLVIEGMQRDSLADGARRGMRIIIGGTVLAGVMLALAALYEATTLILLR